MFSFDAKPAWFPELIEQHGRWQPDRPALIFEDQITSWPAFARQVHQFGSALAGAGMKRGDRVAVVMDNSPEMAITLFGIMAAGAVSVPINLSVTDASMAAMIEDADARAVIVSDAQQARMSQVASVVELTHRLRITTSPMADGWTPWAHFLETGSAGNPLPEIRGDDVLNVIYSSGTTGTPKGIVHTHRGRLDWATDLAVALRYPVGAVTLMSIGLYSNISWVGMLCTLLTGGTLVIQPRFDAADALSLIERYGVTSFAMVPVQYQRLLEAWQATPVSLDSLHTVMSCGSPLQPGLKQQLFEILPGGVIELYGLTEGVITTLQPEDAEGRWSSVGKPLAGTDIRIIDDEGMEVPAGEPGEIVSRGRITMPGYLNREEASRASSWTDNAGQVWLRTGDIGRVDESGFLYIVDRKKDLILSGGQNIYPQDIEAVVAAHDSVSDVAVIPAASERWGETPVALVVTRGQPDLAEVLQWCNERLGRQQRLADLIPVDELPRNPNGKLLKRQLRETFNSLHYS